MTKIVKTGAGALACLALAGTCLVAPAFAEVAEQPAEQPAEQASVETDGQSASAQAEQPSDVFFIAGHAMFAGVQLELPQSWSAWLSPDGSVATFANEDRTAAVGVGDMSGVELPADADLSEFFSKFAEKAVSSFEGASVESLGDGALNDGTAAYAFGANVADDDGDYRIVLVYIPMEQGGFTFVQFGMNQNAPAADVEAIESAIASLSLMPDLSSADFAAAGHDAHIAFEVPEGVVDADKGMWMGMEDNIVIVTTGGLLSGASALTDEDYELLFKLVCSEFGGELISSDTVEAQGTNVRYASYVANVDGTAFYIVVALVPAADDTLSCMLVMCDEPAAQKYNETLFTMLATISLA